MRIEGERTFSATPDEVFAALVDPQLAAATVPGLQDFTVETPERWHGVVRLPVGPKVTFRFEVAERVEPTRARLVAQGKALGGAVRIETAFDLSPGAGGGTHMRYVATTELSGLLGRLGDAKLKPVGEQQVQRVMRAVEKHIGRRRKLGDQPADGAPPIL